MDARSLGRKLKNCRGQRGLTQDACAERAGITTRYLADIERGDKTPRLETFIAILNALDASADAVLQDSLNTGYLPKSCEISRMLEGLSPQARRQALEIFSAVVQALRKG